MPIVIDHLVLPAHDNEASARFLADLLGLPYDGPDRHFAPVRINDTFTLAYIGATDFTSNHVAFHLGEDDFAPILARLRARGIAHGNSPRDPTNGRTDHPFGGPGLFFHDPNGHFFELLTRTRPD